MLPDRDYQNHNYEGASKNETSILFLVSSVSFYAILQCHLIRGGGCSSLGDDHAIHALDVMPFIRWFCVLLFFSEVLRKSTLCDKIIQQSLMMADSEKL